MAFNREAALAEGYTEDEINAYLQGEAEKKKQPAPPVVDVGEPPAPVTKINTVEPTATAAATTGAMAVAPYVGTAALGAGGLYGASVAKQAFDAYKQGNAVKQAHIDLQYEKMANKAGNAPVSSVAPSPLVDQYGKPIPTSGSVNPAAQAATQAQPAQASMKSRVQAAAANSIKNLPGAKMIGKVLPGAGTVLNAVDAYDRAKQGDYGGAAIAGIGAAASPFPVVGTAVGMGAGALNAYLDYRKQQEEEKKRMAQQ